jgi:hypothetical protein
MADINVDELGPVDYLVVAFPAAEANFSGEMATELKALIKSNTVRGLDLVVLSRTRTARSRRASCATPTTVRSGSCALWRATSRSCWPRRTSRKSASRWSLVVRLRCWCGRTWAAPFGSAVRRSGGQLVASGRIPTEALIAAVEADHQAAVKGA